MLSRYLSLMDLAWANELHKVETQELRELLDTVTNGTILVIELHLSNGRCSGAQGETTYRMHFGGPL